MAIYGKQSVQKYFWSWLVMNKCIMRVNAFFVNKDECKLHLLPTHPHYSRVAASCSRGTLQEPFAVHHCWSLIPTFEHPESQPLLAKLEQGSSEIVAGLAFATVAFGERQVYPVGRCALRSIVPAILWIKHSFATLVNIGWTFVEFFGGVRRIVAAALDPLIQLLRSSIAGPMRARLLQLPAFIKHVVNIGILKSQGSASQLSHGMSESWPIHPSNRS